MKLELLTMVSAALANPTYGIAAQLTALADHGPVFGVTIPTPASVNVATAATDDRVARGLAPANLPAAVVAVGLTPSKGGGVVSQGCREWPSVPVVVSWIDSVANAATAWAQSDYLETAIVRAVAQALLDPARIGVAGKVGAVQLETCNGVTSGAVMRQLKDASGLIVTAVSFDLYVVDYQPTLLP